MSVPSPSPDFPSTRWTLVRQVQAGTEADARLAMEEICRTYGMPSMPLPGAMASPQKMQKT